MENATYLRATHATPHGTRDYLHFQPPDQRGANAPLLIMLHGCNQAVDDFAQATRMNAQAMRHRCHVVYLAQSTQANGAKCWNWYDPAHQQREQGEPAIISSLTRHLIASHRIASERVFVAGFSAGGAMAATMAVLYPELYAALGVHSAVPHGAARDFLSALMVMQHGTLACHAAHPMHARIPTIVFHGDADNMVHATHASQFMSEGGKADASPATGERYAEHVAPGPDRYGYTRTVQLDGRKRIFSERWIVHGGGHAWFGGDAASHYVDPSGPDATREMMRFFTKRAG